MRTMRRFFTLSAQKIIIRIFFSPMHPFIIPATRFTRSPASRFIDRSHYHFPGQMRFFAVIAIVKIFHKNPLFFEKNPYHGLIHSKLRPKGYLGYLLVTPKLPHKGNRDSFLISYTYPSFPPTVTFFYENRYIGN